VLVSGVGTWTTLARLWRRGVTEGTAGWWIHNRLLSGLLRLLPRNVACAGAASRPKSTSAGAMDVAIRRI
jgi:hypothetical protein